MLMQTEKMLSKMDRKPSKKKVDMQKMLADFEAKRMKTFYKSEEKTPAGTRV